MFKPRWMLTAIAIGLLCISLTIAGWFGSGDDTGDVTVSWYVSTAPGNADQLVNQGEKLNQSVNNSSISIVDTLGTQWRTNLNLSQYMWAREKIIPGNSGPLAINVKNPDGTIDQIQYGNVTKGYIYTTWFYADYPGIHEIWFDVDGSASNSIWFDVEESPEYGYEYAPAEESGFVGMFDSSASYKMSAPVPSVTIGLSAGGAKDINNFRENIEEGYLPLPTDVTYEGLFYDYYFDTGEREECTKLFCPSYSYAISRDPFSRELEYYLSVGLNSGIKESDFERKKLNLVVVLDNSGSMGSSFDRYYYDTFGNLVEFDESEDSGKAKIEIATESVVSLLDHLKDDDRFGMVIYSDDAFLVEPLSFVREKDMGDLEDEILDITDEGSTNMEAGMKMATDMLEDYLDADQSEYENRIIFLTDAMPNVGETDRGELLEMTEDNADDKLYTTFIGIGVDFNTEIIEYITKIRGANYYSVHSASQFNKRMDDEFEYMVTPLVFNLQLSLDATGYEIQKVYGSPEADEATGEIMKVNTLFPSKREGGEVRGGLILIKLKKTAPDSRMNLKVSYEDRNGAIDTSESSIRFSGREPDYFANTGIRKGILLSRYADLLKNWMIDERSYIDPNEPIVVSVTLAEGIVIPYILGEWERQSMPLHVSEPYRTLFNQFADYFESEMTAIGDGTLDRELVILNKLGSYVVVHQK
jgi:Ca-activated chloride channel family protein